MGADYPNAKETVASETAVSQALLADKQASSLAVRSVVVVAERTDVPTDRADNASPSNRLGRAASDPFLLARTWGELLAHPQNASPRGFVSDWEPAPDHRRTSSSTLVLPTVHFSGQESPVSSYFTHQHQHQPNRDMGSVDFLLPYSKPSDFLSPGLAYREDYCGLFMDKSLSSRSITVSESSPAVPSSALDSRNRRSNYSSFVDLQLPESKTSKKRGIEELEGISQTVEHPAKQQRVDELAPDTREHSSKASTASPQSSHTMPEMPHSRSGPLLPPISHEPYGAPPPHLRRPHLPPLGTPGTIEPAIITAPTSQPFASPRTMTRPPPPAPLDRQRSTSSTTSTSTQPFQLPPISHGYPPTQHHPPRPHSRGPSYGSIPSYATSSAQRHPSAPAMPGPPPLPMHPSAHQHPPPMRYSTEPTNRIQPRDSSKVKPQCWDHGCNGRQFSTFSNLLRHQRERSGTSQKSYCPRCGAEFTRSTARKNHLENGKCRPRRMSSLD